MNLQFQKVIEGLRHHSGQAEWGCWKDNDFEYPEESCPYYDDEDNGLPFCGEQLLNDTIDLLKFYNDFCKWLAHLVAHEDNEGGAEVELICRKLVEMGYVSAEDGHYKEVFSEDEDERDA